MLFGYWRLFKWNRERRYECSGHSDDLALISSVNELLFVWQTSAHWGFRDSDRFTPAAAGGAGPQVTCTHTQTLHLLLWVVVFIYLHHCVCGCSPVCCGCCVRTWRRKRSSWRRFLTGRFCHHSVIIEHRPRVWIFIHVKFVRSAEFRLCLCRWARTCSTQIAGSRRSQKSSITFDHESSCFIRSLVSSGMCRQTAAIPACPVFRVLSAEITLFML